MDYYQIPSDKSIKTQSPPMKVSVSVVHVLRSKDGNIRTMATRKGKGKKKETCAYPKGKL